MTRRINWIRLVGYAVAVGLITFVIFDVSSLALRRLAPSGWQWMDRDTFVLAAVTALGAAIATRHWLAPALIATAFLLMPLQDWLPLKSERGGRLMAAGLAALILMTVEAALLLASLVLVVRGFIRNCLPPRS